MRDRVATVLPATYTQMIIEEVAIQYAVGRRRPHDRAAHFELRQRDAERTAEHRRPRSGRAENHGRSNCPVLSDDRGNAAAFGFDAAYGTSRENRCPLSLGGARNRGRCFVRFGTPVARRIQSATPLDRAASHVLRQLRSRKDSCIQPVFVGRLEPVGKVFELRIRARRKQAAGL